MEDSDEDIVVLEEIKSDKNSKRWKWNAPNPKLPEGSASRILEKVRNKLHMEKPLTNKNVDANLTLDENLKKSKPPNLANSVQVQKTPQKSSDSHNPISLTPEQILELTENCLDSDNEPEITPTKSLLQSQEQNHVQKAAPKRALSFSVKISNNVQNRASKFFGAGTSREDLEEILGRGDESLSRTVSPTKSPSAKKKRLSKNSPIRSLPSHRNLGKSPGRFSPGKSPSKSPGRSPGRGFGRSPSSLSPKNIGPGSGNVSNVMRNLNAESETETEVIPGGPYYSEAFCHIVKKVSNNSGFQHLFLETEMKNLKEIDRSTKEFQLYVRLMNRKDKWNRTSDIRYNDISEDLSPLFDTLEKQGYISCDLSDEKLEVLLNLLKMEELKTLCTTFKVKKVKNKPELVEALLNMQRTQRTLDGNSPVLKSVKEILGRCVRLTVAWRLVFRRCILLFSMFHSFEDLDKLSSEQALLLLQVKHKNMVFPVNETSIQSCTQIFISRDQLIRYEEAKELNQELNIAIETKNNQIAEDLTRKSMKLLSTLLELSFETNHVRNLPQYLQKFCAGSTYAYVLTKSVDAMKQGRKYEIARDVLKLLSNQKVYCPHYQGRWALKLSSLLHINLKNIVEACKVLCSAMKDRHLLSPVDRMHLQQRAEKVYKLKKNGLSKELKDQLASVMDSPREPPESVEICARAFVGNKPGLKKVYIRDTNDGKEFMSVEETVIAHYKTLGFMYGIHDEGSTISSLCLLALWDYIYDVRVPSVFLSPYQDKPLDWGSKTFYETRKNAIEAHFAKLLLQDVQSAADYLCDYRDQHFGKTSVVNWDRLDKLDIHAFLYCVSMPVFVAISRRLVEDWKSHRSGFPDLIVWSPPQRKCIFIEVKSPNDTLSTVQYLWLDYLKKFNANAIVAHIRESGSKSLSATMT